MFSASVVITTKNRREDLVSAIESAMVQRGLLEVVVIDDGSTDGTADELKKKFSEFSFQFPGEQPATAPSPATSYSSLVTTGMPVLRFIRHEVSEGYIVRRNEGARVARGDVIFSLDDDAVFSSPFVVEQTLRDFSYSRIGAVAIPYIEPHKANREMQRAPTREDVWVTASYIGTAHAVRREVFLALGGYREHLVHQGEEGDLCIRMLAADAEQLITDGGVRRTDVNLFNHGGHGDHGVLVCSEAGIEEKAETLKSEKLKEVLTTINYSINTLSTTISPCDATPVTSYPPPVTAPEVPGFFVRLGNSDPIIHNESPKRDYSRMDFYGRRNDILFHWQNTPMPDLLWQLPMTIAGGMFCAYRVKRWRKMLEGIGAGFLAIAGGVERKPLGKTVAVHHKNLKRSPQRL